MVKLTAEEKRKLEEQIQEQDEETYGTGHTDGDQDLYSNTKDMVKEVTGNEPDPERDGFSIAEEVEKDEEDIEAGSDQQTDTLDEDL